MLMATPAGAVMNNTYSGMTGPQMAAFLRSKGYQGELTTDKGGDPTVFSSTGGTKFAIFFYDCDQSAVKTCSTIQFSSLFDNNKNWAPADANRCNSTRARGRVFINSDSSSVIVDYTLPMNGVDDEYLETALERWSSVVSGFQHCMLEQRQ
jgi:hypothetical protein